MSTIEVDKIIPQSGTDTQLGEASDTINVPSGATLNINSGATITNNGTASGFDTDTNDKVKVSANDTTAGFLNGKLVAGTNISLTEGSDGGNETLTAALSGTITPSDNTVTLAKMAPGTDGNLISYDASGNPVAVATGNDGQVLTSTGAGSTPAFETLPVGGITEADQWRLTTSFTGDASPLQNLERVDRAGWGKIGTGMSESAGIFTFPSTGIWFVKFRVNTVFTGGNRYCTAAIQVTTNNSSYGNIASGEQGIYSDGGNYYANTLVETLIDCDTTAYTKVRFAVDNESNSTTVNGDTNVTYTNMMFIRLGDR